MALTYPQCPLDKGTTASQLKEALSSKGVKQLVVVQEHHSDGSLHLHAYVALQDRYTQVGKHTSLILTRKEKMADGDDKVVEYYPNVQGVKNKLQWLTYLSKEDKEPYEYGITLAQFLQASVNKTKILGKRLIQGEPLKAIVEEEGN